MGLECRTCPYGKHEFEKRVNFCEKFNLFDDEIPLEEELKELENSIECDKVDAKVSEYGTCGEVTVVSNKKKEQLSRKPRHNKRERDLLYKNHLKELAKNCFGCYYCDEIYKRGEGFVPISKPYYKRFYRRRASKYFKKISNRKIRKYKGDIPYGCFYHKLYDYWWEID